MKKKKTHLRGGGLLCEVDTQHTQMHTIYSCLHIHGTYIHKKSHGGVFCTALGYFFVVFLLISNERTWGKKTTTYGGGDLKKKKRQKSFNSDRFVACTLPRKRSKYTDFSSRFILLFCLLFPWLVSCLFFFFPKQWGACMHT
uniref:Transmembrane protein n=1 Tax=Lotharella globosa TaxID=91324 RepID=A0A7S4DVV5_9EUKA